MFKLLKSVGIILLSATLVMTGCSSPVKSTPTVDAQTAFTQAAETAQSILTQGALLTPSATATFTPTMTNTPEPTTATFTATLITPLASATLTPQISSDVALYIDQSPADGTIVTPGSEFNVTWRLKNTGLTTWSTRYRLRFYSGTFMSPVNAVNFPNAVRPQEEVTITLPIKAPATAGEYTTTWVLSNEQDVNFYPLYIRIVVGAPAPTGTATATLEPTATTIVTP